MQQTKIPPQLDMIYDTHMIGMGKVVSWLEDLGIVIFHKPHILETTVLDIHIRHANDYVDMGALDDDPKGEMFYCYTAQAVEFDVPFGIMGKVGQALKANQSIGKERIADNVEIATDVTNQYIMQDHIFADDYSWEKFGFTIEFRVHHMFN